jgi:esterase/lipase
MIDQLYSVYGRRKEKPLDPDYKPSDVIVGQKFLDTGNDKLVVIFPGWHSHNFPVNILAKRLYKQGWSVLWYDFHDQILEPEEEIVVQSLRYLRDKVCDDISQITHKKPYRQIHFISISLGGVPMALVCDKFKHFSGVTAVVGGDDLAVDMWHGQRTQHLRYAFEKMHVGIRKLSKEWDNIGPDHHLRYFRDKPVKIIMSMHDTFVPTKYQQKLTDELLQADALVKLKRRFTGHTLTIVRFCLLDNPV